MVAMAKEKKAILHIGAGKLNHLDINNPDVFQVFVDLSYCAGTCNTVAECEELYMQFFNNGSLTRNDYFIGFDIFQFMDTFKFKFNEIKASRIFEHMEYTSGQIGRLLEACNCLCVEGGTLEIIVPNSLRLSNMLIQLEKDIDTFGGCYDANKLLIVNTEFTNCSHIDPHCSIWTPNIAKVYIEPEGTWEIKEVVDNIYVNGRDIYFKIVLSKKINPAKKEIVEDEKIS